MAINLHNEITVKRSDNFEITVEGAGADTIPVDDGNLVLRAVKTVFDRVEEPLASFQIRCVNRIPLARGLGSSSAAVVSGLVAANHFLSGPLTFDDLLKLGTAIEGHPDNVAPALFGGCRVVVQDGGDLIQNDIPLRGGLELALFIPEFEMPTQQARQVLPETITRAEAVYNIGRTALLVAALSQGRWNLLKTATQDSMHQDARQKLFPAMGEIFASALEAGAVGVFLSGAGPTVLAFAPGLAEAVSRAMAKAGEMAGISGRALVALPSETGAEIVERV
jgi:homoserine kinase